MDIGITLRPASPVTIDYCIGEYIHAQSTRKRKTPRKTRGGGADNARPTHTGDMWRESKVLDETVRMSFLRNVEKWVVGIVTLPRALPAGGPPHIPRRTQVKVRRGGRGRLAGVRLPPAIDNAAQIVQGKAWRAASAPCRRGKQEDENTNEQKEHYISKHHES